MLSFYFFIKSLVSKNKLCIWVFFDYINISFYNKNINYSKNERKNMKKAFTLAEVMITLTVIGIITAVIVPVAIHSKPDEDTLKFKKAHNVLYKTIKYMVESDKYYKNGDLGIRADGTQIAGGLIGDDSSTTGLYFCNTFTDLVSAKNNCAKRTESTDAIAEYGFVIGMGAMGDGKQNTENIANPIHKWDTVKKTVTQDEINKTKGLLDEACKEHTEEGEEMKTTDNVVYYEIGTAYAKFGSACPGLDKKRGLKDGEPAMDKQYRCFGKYGWQKRYRYQDQYGNDNAYKTFCIDIDGIPSGGSSKCDDVKDICPFGYGIRADGKILAGKRADEWLSRSIQSEN